MERRTLGTQAALAACFGRPVRGHSRPVTTSTSPLTRSRHVARSAAESDWTRRLAGVGLAARSALYAVLGILVLQVAYGSDRLRTDSTGALHAIARQPSGRAILVLLALGFAAYALWRFAEAAVAHPGRERDALIRLIDAGRGLVYCGLAVLAVGTIVGSGRARGDGQEQEWTARVMEWPGGRVLVAAVGIGVIVGGLTNAWHLIDGSWRRNIDLDRCPQKLRPMVTGFAVVGLLGRVFVFLAIGVFVVKAAVQYDPRQAVGLDGALHRLARAEYGTEILVAVAIGLLAYAAYSVVEAMLRPSAES
jgi:hypothetical protein